MRPISSAVPPRKAPNSNAFGGGKHGLDDEANQSEKCREQKNSQILGEGRAGQRRAFGAGIQKHDDENKQNHDRAGVYDHLRCRDEFATQL